MKTNTKVRIGYCCYRCSLRYLILHPNPTKSRLVWYNNIQSFCNFLSCLVVSMPCFVDKWWRRQMETFSASLALCEGNAPVTGKFPSQRPVTRSFDVFFDLRLKKGVKETIETPVIWDTIALIMTPLLWKFETIWELHKVIDLRDFTKDEFKSDESFHNNVQEKKWHLVKRFLDTFFMHRS